MLSGFRLLPLPPLLPLYVELGRKGASWILSGPDVDDGEEPGPPNDRRDDVGVRLQALRQAAGPQRAVVQPGKREDAVAGPGGPFLLAQQLDATLSGPCQ